MHLIIFLIVLSSAACAGASPASSSKWHRLLHYRKTWQGFESDADGPRFFLSPKGKRDPQAELEETIRLFDSGELSDDHPICRFPLRYKWLNRELGTRWSADLSKCQAYGAFTEKLAARRASVVFSSNYLTNPSSAFGHTLLRLSRFENGNETELLDYGVNFGARADSTNPLAYLWNGFTGGFPGTFAATPYYYKIREYADLEFRDLWSYDLRLTPEEVSELVDHVWELSQTHFDYFYLKENCAFHVLGLINVVRPEHSLTERFALYTVPAETLRVLRDQRLIGEGKRRESTVSRLSRVSSQLPLAELRLAHAVAENPSRARELLGHIDSGKAARILDTAIEAYDYRHAREILREDPKTVKRKFPLLQARAMNPVITDLSGAAGPAVEDPAYGHAPLRLSSAYRSSYDGSSGVRLEVRPALHDLLDPEVGALQHGALEMGTLSLELRSKPGGPTAVMLDRLTILSARNYPPQSFWMKPLAWELEVGARDFQYVDCFNCPGAYLSGGAGASFLAGDFLGALLLTGELDVQSQFQDLYRLGAGPKFFLRYRFHQNLVAGLASRYQLNTYRPSSPFQDASWEHEAELRFQVSQNVSLFTRAAASEGPAVWRGVSEFGLRYFP